MTFNNITSSNAEAVLVVEDLYPAGIVLEQFSTDQSFALDDVTYTENRMGVDGKMVSGFVPSIKAVSLTLEASSPSFTSLAQVCEVMTQNKTVYPCTLVISIPSISKVYTYSNGVIKSGKIFPDNKKTLDPVTFKIEFESLKSSDI